VSLIVVRRRGHIGASPNVSGHLQGNEMKKIVALRAAVLASLVAAAASAHAELPAAITTELGNASTDLKAAAALLIGAMLGFWALRTIGKKLGWWG